MHVNYVHFWIEPVIQIINQWCQSRPKRENTYCFSLLQYPYPIIFFFSLSFWPFCHFLDKYLWSWMFPPKGMKKRIPFPKTCFCLSLTFWVRLNESVYIQSKNFKIILQQTHYKYFLITIESWRQDIEEPFC